MGNPLADTYAGTDGRPIVVEESYATVYREYDRSGNLVGMRFAGVAGEPVVLKSMGVAGTRKTFDRQGNEVRSEFYGLDGKPAASLLGYASLVRTFDNRRNVTSVRYYDVDGKPGREASSGLSGEEYRLDRSGNYVEYSYLGPDGGLMDRKDNGVARILAIYEGSKLIRSESFDSEGRPVSGKPGSP
jgi:hypothetical protein